MRLLASALLLASSSLSAQSVEFVSTPGSLTGVVTRVVRGDITPDMDPDVVLVDSGEPVLVYGTGLFNTMLKMRMPVNDVAIAYERGLAGRDAIARVSSAGLVLSTYVGGTTPFTHTTLATGPWTTAVEVQASRRDPDLFLGLDADRQTFLVFDEGLGTTTSLVLPEVVLDWAPLDWDADGVDDVALVTTGGLHAMDLAGIPLSSFPVPLDWGAVTSLERSATGDTAAFLVRLAGTIGHHLLAAGSTGWQPSVPLGPIEPYDITSGDWDGDGWRDAVIMARAAGSTDGLYPLVARNVSATEPQAFLASALTTIDLGITAVPGAGQVADAVLWDFSRDGDEDLVTWSAEDDALVLVHNPTVNHTLHALDTDWYDILLGPSGLTLQVEFEPPLRGLQGATHLVFNQWDADFNDVGDAVELDPVGVDSVAVPFSGFAAPMLVPMADYGLDRLRYLQVCMAIFDNGEPDTFGPASGILLLSGDDEGDQLETIFGVPPMDPAGAGSDALGGSLGSGGLIEPPTPPAFDDSGGPLDPDVTPPGS